MARITWYAIYNPEDGQLISIGSSEAIPEPRAPLIFEECLYSDANILKGSRPDFNRDIWNALTHQFDPLPSKEKSPEETAADKALEKDAGEWTTQDCAVALKLLLKRFGL
jgi:hypothetical protein